MNSLLKRALIIVSSVLLIDQIVKIWIKTHMYLGQEFRITNWFIIHFTENNGMAFGLELGGDNGKLFLSVFRILASLGIGWYLLHLIRKNAHPGLIVCFSFIFAGAMGNIIDSVFYGMIFSDSYHGISRIFPVEGGYAGFLHGQVVDMLYFPLISGVFPDWVPVWGGESFLFFRPVFNIADASITTGAILFLLFQKRFTRQHELKQSDPEGSLTEEKTV
jgi:signal peptidase II